MTANNEIQDVSFKEHEEWLVTGLTLKTKKLEDSDEYKEVEKVSNLINKIKNEKINNITHGEIETKLPNFAHFDVDTLVCLNRPEEKHMIITIPILKNEHN